MHRVDLVRHPLAGNARRVRPEQTKLEVLARIPLSLSALLATVEQETIPIRVLFANFLNQLRASPASGLIDVPGHLNHHDLAKLGGLNKLVRANVVTPTTSLTTDLHNLLRLFNRFEDCVRIFHRVGHRLLDVRITTGPYCFDSV